MTEHYGALNPHPDYVKPDYLTNSSHDYAAKVRDRRNTPTGPRVPQKPVLSAREEMQQELVHCETALQLINRPEEKLRASRRAAELRRELGITQNVQAPTSDDRAAGMAETEIVDTLNKLDSQDSTEKLTAGRRLLGMGITRAVLEKSLAIRAAAREAEAQAAAEAAALEEKARAAAEKEVQ